MHQVRKCLAIAAFTVAGIAGTGAASAQYLGPIGKSGYTVTGPLFMYHEQIEKMSPEDKAKLMAMSDKMEQSEMDYKMNTAKAQAQHEMEMAKMHRDMEMWIVGSRMGH
jgi:hypothetical protein